MATVSLFNAAKVVSKPPQPTPPVAVTAAPNKPVSKPVSVNPTNEKYGAAKSTSKPVSTTTTAKSVFSVKPVEKKAAAAKPVHEPKKRGRKPKNANTEAAGSEPLVEKVAAEVNLPKRKPGRPSKIGEKERKDEEIKQVAVAQEKLVQAGVVTWPVFNVGTRVRQIEKVVVGEIRHSGVVVRQDIGSYLVLVRFDDGAMYWVDAVCIEIAPEKAKRKRKAKVSEEDSSD